MASVSYSFLAAFFASLFGHSGASKLRAWRAFRRQLLAFELLPRLAVSPAALAIPAIELALAAAALVPSLSRGAFVGLSAVLVVFTTALLHALRAKRQVACFCFGEADGEISSLTVVRNLILLGAAALAVCLAPSGGPGGSGQVDLVRRALCYGYGTSAAALFVATFRMLDLLPKLKWLK